MSVIRSYEEIPYKLPTRCFLCGKKLSYPFVHWMGCDGEDEDLSNDICLHPDCVIDIFVRLMRDVCEVKYSHLTYWRTLGSPPKN